MHIQCCVSLNETFSIFLFSWFCLIDQLFFFSLVTMNVVEQVKKNETKLNTTAIRIWSIIILYEGWRQM